MSSSGTSTPQLPKANPSTSNQNASLPQYSLPGPQVQGSKYNQLLAVIEELGKDIRPTYAGNKICAERLKRNLIHARILTKESFLSHIINDLIIASTYQLDAGGEIRDGKFVLLSSSPLSTKSVIPTSAGIFRFTVIDANTVLACLTNGKLVRANINESAVCFESQEALSDVMLLTVSQSPSGDRILTSDNKGQVIVADSWDFKNVSSWDGHKLPYTNEPCEVWSSCWLDDNRICSGAEDGIMKLWDLRSTEKPIAVNKNFEAGVVFIEQFGSEILTGSYDEHLRVFDERKLSEPLRESKLNGGVWQVNRIVGDDFRLICACMYGGWQIIDSQSLETVAENQAIGKDLLYGASAVCCEENKYSVACCTFNNYTVTVESVDV
ncbi:hypothetical protein QR680_012269 [Steinernema hermaphroditum]|uniref:methylated diphthine methylhydrolase n=1 Tax=Steinernema hermaphroditum TaxID=289476 RepID=A0AA39I3G0_9BILA|nr:hypothetical protein QR680_012269 [Steinernema hermaphroditum]